MDTNNLVDQIKKLISYHTVSTNKDEIRSCMEYIKSNLCHTSTCKITEYEVNTNPIAIISTHDTKTPDVAFLCHIDVVSAHQRLFHMEKHKGKIIGRGVSDMKFSIPICADILTNAHSNYPNASIALILTSDEEHGGLNGAGYVANVLKYRPKLLFIPDGGNNWELVSQAKGVLHGTITVSGTSAHASQPWKGISANDKALSILLQLRKLYKQPKIKSWNAITMNIGVINGGNSVNQVPNLCVIKLDFRYPNEKDKELILSNIKKLLSRKETFSVFQADAFSTDIRDTKIQQYLSISEKIIKRKIPVIKEYGASDARFFSIHNIPCIVIKPECGGEHADNEWIDIKDMLSYHKTIHTYLTWYNEQYARSSPASLLAE